jgi:serine/threonine protein kinase/Flp pilus assembly protein TadD
MRFAPGTRLGPYEIVSAIGAGGMGEVYRASDTRLGRNVAIKVLPSTFSADADRLLRFEREARAVSALSHPNILTVYDIGTYDGAPYLVSELLEGQTLRECLAQATRGTPFSPREAIECAAQIAQGLCAAHEKGTVHRDIKPENVFIRSDGWVKILDFGLAKLVQQPSASGDTGAATLVQYETEPGVMMGTILYMSPEQVRGLPLDERTDVFSLGVVLYEMVAGRCPFAAPTQGDVIVSILEREPPPLAIYVATVPQDLERIASRALRKDRAERYQTAKELALDLENLAHRLSIEAALERAAPPPASGWATTVVNGRAAAPAPARAARKQRARKAIDSLAVLPLVNASPDQDSEYLSDGITESIINSLARLPKLRVVPRSTVFRYKGRHVDPEEAGRELGVRAVLMGRMLRLGDTLVITTELVDAATNSQLWGEQYKRKVTDIFALQEEISSDISEKLRLKLSGDERKRLTKRYTENTEAYHLYLKGRYFLSKRARRWLRRAAVHFQQAIDVDPDFALAYAGLADAYALLGSANGGLAPSQVYPKAKAAVMKALELDDTLAEPHTSLGFFLLLYDWDWAGAGREFKRAIELNPNYAAAHDGYGFYCKARGKTEEAIQACVRAWELDPLSPFVNISLAWAYYFARQFDRAVEHARKVLEMDSGFAFAYWCLGLAYEQKGLYEDAIAAFWQGATLAPEDVLTFPAHLGRAYALAGRHAEARRVLNELGGLSEHRYVSSYYFAIIHAGLGEVDWAFEWLERAYEERSGFLAFLGVEPMLDGLRTDPRFADLARRVGIGAQTG